MNDYRETLPFVLSLSKDSWRNAMLRQAQHERVEGKLA
tara:strand:+ start:1407 stop:1520 length:114 start_codon:yes stop_codon:yes gene_type:complete